LFSLRYGPLSFWLPPPANLPSPPFLSLLPLIVSSLHASLCIVVVGAFVVVVGARGRLPYVEFSLIPVRTGADFSFASVPFDIPVLVVMMCLLCSLLFQRWCCVPFLADRYVVLVSSDAEGVFS
jgi:hypothetical protein